MKVLTGTNIGTEPSIHWALSADLGKLIAHRMTNSKEEMKALFEVILANNKFFICGEWTPRTKTLPTKEEVAQKRGLTRDEFYEIIKQAGNKYLGRQILGEFGGNVFWPYKYLKNPPSDGGGPYGLLPKATSVLEAKEHFVNKVRKYIEIELDYGCGPFYVTDSGMMFKYLLEAAKDRIELYPALEMMPGNPEILFSAIRGAVRAFGHEKFGALIAFGWYGGGKWDELYFKRWELALKYAYLSGTFHIRSEDGQFGLESHYNYTYAIDSNEARQFRKVMRDFAEFCEKDERPEGGPIVKFGMISGNLDGFNGTDFSKTVWGQYEAGEQWKYADAEKTWNTLKTVNSRPDWHFNCNQGNTEFSGHPPYGLYDIVPAESPIENLSRYSCLIFMGWNTMTPDIYKNLCQYVRNGGLLLAALPHCAINICRDEVLKLYNDGDLSELFGVKINGKSKSSVHGVKFKNHETFSNLDLPDWTEISDVKFASSGFKVGNLSTDNAITLIYSAELFDSRLEKSSCLPVLTGYRNGKGQSFLLNAWEYPGSDNLADLWKFLLLTFMKSQAPGKLEIIAQEAIRYALYGESGNETVYILNTDFEFSANCRINSNNNSAEFSLKPCQMMRMDIKELATEKNDGNISQKQYLTSVRTI